MLSVFSNAGPSLERQRATFEKREIELMAGVRELRRKLAERLTKPPRFSLEDAELSSSIHSANLD
jgi:hypothetical protein